MEKDGGQQPVTTGVKAPPAAQNVDVENRRADYNKLVRTARLAGIILEKVNFKIVPDALTDSGSHKRSLRPITKIMSTGIDDGTCVANIVWEVNFRNKNKNVVKCNASYIISYEGIADCTEDTVTVFLENVGKVATYAYFRALYAHLDWSANLGSPPLPVVQMQPNI